MPQYASPLPLMRSPSPSAAATNIQGPSKYFAIRVSGVSGPREAYGKAVTAYRDKSEFHFRNIGHFFFSFFSIYHFILLLYFPGGRVAGGCFYIIYIPETVRNVNSERAESTVMGKNSFMVPVLPRRCDHLRYRIPGTGDVKPYSIARTVKTRI